MLNVRLSLESLLFYRQNNMNARSFNRSVNVVHDDGHQEIGDFGFVTPIAPRTRASQKKFTETEGEIQGVTPLLPAPTNLHKRFSESVLYNTPSRIVQIALEEPKSKPMDSKKTVAKRKRNNSSHPSNASKTVTEERVKVDKKQNSKQRTKLGAKKRSVENTQEPVAISSELADTPTTNPLLHDVSQPATKRPKIISDLKSLSTTIESVVAASAENIGKNEESDQTSTENLERKTVSKVRTKQLAKKFASTPDAKPVDNRREKKDLEVPTHHVAGETVQSTSLLKGAMSSKQSLGKSLNRSGPITTELNDELFSKKATDAGTSIESENDTCSSASDGEEDLIFSRGQSNIKKRCQINSIISDIFDTPRKTVKTSESSLSPEFPHEHKLSKSLPGIILPASRKQHSLYEHSSTADWDLITVEKENHKHKKELLLESAQNKKSLKNLPTSKLETSRISANANTRKEDVTRKPEENGKFTHGTSHLLDNMKPNDGSPALKRKGSTSFAKTLSPSKQCRAGLNASQHDQPPVDRDGDTFKNVQGTIPTQRSIMPQTEESMLQSPNYRMTLSSISAQCNVAPVPAEHPTRFNLYMAPAGYPVRARQLLSTEDFLVSWLDLQPSVIFPIQTSYRTMVMRLKGNVEFRSNPYVPSRILVNSIAKIVELEAGRLLHIANTGEEVASIQMTEVLQ